jgi:hypothetical protein
MNCRQSAIGHRRRPLVTDTQPFAGSWAREAEAVLPQRSIIGFEIGNEPDLCGRTFWLALGTEGDRFGARVPPA